MANTNGNTNGDVGVQLPPSTPLEKLPQINPSKHITDSNGQKMLHDLLKADHSTIAPLREPDLILHSHMPHILGSALGLGLSADFLKEAHNEVVPTLIEIDDKFPRGEKIEPGRYREFIGNKKYTVAFVDFFDREFAKANGDWKKVTEEYLFSPKHLLMNGGVGGLGHPLIHLGYAYEYDCKETASEGLSLLCTDFASEVGSLVDHPQPQLATYRTKSLAGVMERVRTDKRFQRAGLTDPGITNMEAVFVKCGNAVLEHLEAWEIGDPLESLQHICDLATVLAITTSDARNEFDFYIIHFMTIAYALRVIWDVIPKDRQAPMLREYALFIIVLYVSQLSPQFDTKRIDSVDLKGRDWNWVKKTAAAHPAKFDVHFFKVVRAPLSLEETFGEKDGFYLKSAVKFLDEYKGWTGFGKGLDGFDPKGEGWTAPENKL